MNYLLVMNKVSPFKQYFDNVVSYNYENLEEEIKNSDIIIDGVTDLNNVECIEYLNHILPLIKKHNKTFVFLSSSRLYGNTPDAKENYPYVIEDPYLVVTAYLEQLVISSDVKSIILRTVEFNDELNLGVLVKKAIKGEIVTIYETPNGEDSFVNFIDIDDIVKIIKTVSEVDYRKDKEIINVATHRIEYTYKDLVRRMETLLNRKIPMIYSDKKIKHIRLPNAYNLKYFGYDRRYAKSLDSMILEYRKMYE